MGQSGFPGGRPELLPTPLPASCQRLQRALVGEGVQRLSDAVNLLVQHLLATAPYFPIPHCAHQPSYGEALSLNWCLSLFKP